MVVAGLLYWFWAAMMLREAFFPFVGDSAPSAEPLLAMLAGCCGLG